MGWKGLFSGPRVLAASLVVGACGLAAATPASAQTCDPRYGCEQPSPDEGSRVLGTEETRPEPGCTAAGSTVAGGRMNAIVTDVPVGTDVRLLLDGIEVGRKTASSARSAEADVAFSFVVPALAGARRLEAVGAGISASCGDVVPTGVLSAGTTQGGQGPLARTGMTVAPWVLAGAVLIVVGRVVLFDADRRRPRPRTAR